MLLIPKATYSISNQCFSPKRPLIPHQTNASHQKGHLFNTKPMLLTRRPLIPHQTNASHQKATYSTPNQCFSPERPLIPHQTNASHQKGRPLIPHYPFFLKMSIRTACEKGPHFAMHSYCYRTRLSAWCGVERYHTSAPRTQLIKDVGFYTTHTQPSWEG